MKDTSSRDLSSSPPAEHRDDETVFLPRLFLHFFDRYHGRLARHSFLYPVRLIEQEQRLAFRLAALLSRGIYLSVSAYLENPLARRILKEHQDLCEAGFVQTVARDLNLSDHVERKREVHYGDRSPPELRAAYMATPRMRVPYTSAPIRTAATIDELWVRAVDSGTLVRELNLDRSSYTVPANFEEIWADIPHTLEGAAFVAPHVQRAFTDLGVAPPSELQLMRILDPGYTLSHTRPLRSGIVTDLVYLQTPWTVDTAAHGFSYKRVRNALMSWHLLGPIDQAEAHRVLELRLAPSWRDVARALNSHRADTDADTVELPAGESLEDVRQILNRRMAVARRLPSRRTVGQIGIVTALPAEWLAIITALSAEEIGSPDNDPNRYAIATLERPSDPEKKAIEVIVTFLPRMGTNSAAAAATNLLRSFPSIDDLVFSGIAGGCPCPSDPTKHVRLGDLVVSDQRGIVQTDHQAVRDRRTQNRSNMPPPSRRLLNSVRLIEADTLQKKTGWQRHLAEIIEHNSRFARPRSSTDVLLNENGATLTHPYDDHRTPTDPKVVHGAIGSSNTLLRSWRLRDRLVKRHDIRAFEMEGAGTAEAVWQFGKSYLIIRGICDYGDDRTKDDTWHMYASAAAAAYTKEVIQRL